MEAPVSVPGMAKPAVPTGTSLGPVHIAVTTAERALPVWRDMVGLAVLSQTPEAIALGAGGEALIVLEPGAARPAVPNTAGLYHVAIHVPRRRDLAVAIARLYANRFRNAPTDHLATEATYLWDHDGNGIELTFETPERGHLVTDGETFYAVARQGRRHSGREPLDLDSLLGELGPGEDLGIPLPAGTRIGHVHVHVADLDAAMHFYSDVVGFAPQMLARRVRMGDVTLGYPPHIVAFNTWAGEGAKQPPENSAGLRYFTIRLPDQAAFAAMRRRLQAAAAPIRDLDDCLETADPSGNRLRIGVR